MAFMIITMFQAINSSIHVYNSRKRKEIEERWQTFEIQWLVPWHLGQTSHQFYLPGTNCQQSYLFRESSTGLFFQIFPDVRGKQQRSNSINKENFKITAQGKKSKSWYSKLILTDCRPVARLIRDTKHFPLKGWKCVSSSPPRLKNQERERERAVSEIFSAHEKIRRGS